MASPDRQNCLSRAVENPNPISDKYMDDAVSRAIPLTLVWDSHSQANLRMRHSPVGVATVSVDDLCAPVNGYSKNVNITTFYILIYAEVCVCICLCVSVCVYDTLTVASVTRNQFLPCREPISSKCAIIS